MKKLCNMTKAGILLGTHKNIYSQSIIELFENQVASKPNSIAIKHNEKEVSYKELSLLINKISNYITQIPRRQNRIGIFVENSIETIASIFAVLKINSTYIPLDIDNGVFRNKEIILDSTPDFLLISENILKKMELTPDWSNAKQFLKNHFNVIIVEDALTSGKIDLDVFVNENHITNLAYIMYTSGSTGKPKGVMVSHKNLLNYLCWAKDQYISTKKPNEPLSFVLYTSIAFDLTITTLFLPLITGNTIVIYNFKNSGYALGKIIKDNLVDIIKLTPAHLKIISDLDVGGSKLKTMIVGGEVLQSDLVRKINDLFLSKITIYNEYGPTEATVGCMIHKYDPYKDVKSAIPIGKPISNTNIYILNENKLPVKKNEIGELYISGESVACGYLNRKDITENRFIADIYSDYYTTMYKTNDLAFVQDDGTVMFVGRPANKSQVEISDF